MNNSKYLVGLAGLALGFIVSFLWVSSYNRSNAPVAQPSSGAMPGGMAAAGNSGDQQAVMAQVQQVISKAKNNPQ
ncbi:MAG TPA: hypothetical protein VIS78_13960, partial [Blastocatellia bacterium]